VLQCTRSTDRSPQANGVRVVKCEWKCPAEQSLRLVDVVAADREFRRAMKPRRRLALETLSFVDLVRPRERKCLERDRLVVVVRQQRRVLVATPTEPLEPPREPRMQMRAP
jgi:hypothetical protein